MAKVVETSNFDEDYPMEKFLNVAPTTMEAARVIASSLQQAFGSRHERCWKAVLDDYVLNDKGPND